MPKIVYVPKKFRGSSREVIEQAEQICREYADQGMDLTLRQLYYQFVSRNLIPNKDTEYDRLGSIVNDARLAGLIDWNHLIDRTRNLMGLSHWTNPQSIINSTRWSYRTDRWADQDTRVEVWIEKDALVGVIGTPARTYDVDYFSCRGYTSQSEMWRAAERLKRYEENGQNTVILHLGDHDPSGVDMSRDIADRLALFGAETDVRRIALTMDQVSQYNPPPNPAKLSDGRARAYIERYGPSSWELDALNPTVLRDLVDDHLGEIRDLDRWMESTSRMEDEQRQLEAVATRWPEVSRYLGFRG
jgi:hypothetical protein